MFEVRLSREVCVKPSKDTSVVKINLSHSEVATADLRLIMSQKGTDVALVHIDP